MQQIKSILIGLEETSHLCLNNKSKHCMKMSNQKKFLEKHANTDRYRKSSIPYMQRILNQEHNIVKTLLSKNNVSSYASELRLSRPYHYR